MALHPPEGGRCNSETMAFTTGAPAKTMAMTTLGMPRAPKASSTPNAPTAPKTPAIHDHAMPASG